MFPGLFLDRDGVIIENRDHYVRNWDDVSFIPGSLNALSMVESSPYKVVIVTNQSAVGRGLISLECANKINQRMVSCIINHGGRVDGVYICPHTPEDRCLCRKPNPGMLLQASRDLNLDLARSILIGDAISDIQAGRACGVQRLILVRTGRGTDQLGLPGLPPLETYQVEASLEKAISHLLKNGLNYAGN